MYRVEVTPRPDEAKHQIIVTLKKRRDIIMVGLAMPQIKGHPPTQETFRLTSIPGYRCICIRGSPTCLRNPPKPQNPVWRVFWEYAGRTIHAICTLEPVTNRLIQRVHNFGPYRCTRGGSPLKRSWPRTTFFKPQTCHLGPRFFCFIGDFGLPSPFHDPNMPSCAPPKNGPMARTSHLGRGQLPSRVGVFVFGGGVHLCAIPVS